MGNPLKEDVFLIDGLRTILAGPHRSLKNFTAAQLASILIQKILRKNKFNPRLVSEVILGNVVSSGTGQNLARQAALSAGLPESVPAYMVNNVCGAGMQAVVLAAQSILSGSSDVIIAGGTESTTHMPFLIEKYRGKQADSLLIDGLFCSLTQHSMGELVEAMARKHDISRGQQDQYSLESHRKAALAQSQKKYAHEIFSTKKSKKMNLKDDRPRANLTLKYLKNLPSAFKKGGSVTAGNSSIPCDGAAVVLAASAQFLKKHSLKPLARIVGFSSIALHPKDTFQSSVDAIKDVLKKCSLHLRDIDLFEVSEAFAAQVIFTKRKLGIPDEKLNIYGGDVAFGHPLGAAGARVIVTLMHALRNEGLKRGVASISYGGGGGMAIVIERI